MNLIKFDHVSAWRIPDSCSGSFYGLDQNLAASWYAKNHGVPNLSPFNISFLSFSTKEKLMLPPKGEPQHGGIFSFGRRSPLVATRKAQVNSSVKSCNLQKASYVTSFGFCLRMSLVYHLLPLYIYIILYPFKRIYPEWLFKVD
jgi:hypothetical protein